MTEKLQSFGWVEMEGQRMNISQLVDHFNTAMFDEEKDFQYEYPECMKIIKDLTSLPKRLCNVRKLNALMKSITRKISTLLSYRLMPALLTLFIYSMKKSIAYYIKSVGRKESEKRKQTKALCGIAESFQNSCRCTFMFNHSQLSAIKQFYSSRVILEIGSDGNLVGEVLNSEGVKTFSDPLQSIKHTEDRKIFSDPRSYNPSHFLKNYSETISSGLGCLLLTLPIKHHDYDIKALNEYERLGGEDVIFCGDPEWCGSEKFVEKMGQDYHILCTFEGAMPMPLVSFETDIESLFVETHVYMLQKIRR